MGVFGICLFRVMGLSKSPGEKNKAGKEKSLRERNGVPQETVNSLPLELFKQKADKQQPGLLYKGFLPEGFANEFLDSIPI